ncbi:transposase, partial [Natranaerobius trueperi]
MTNQEKAIQQLQDRCSALERENVRLEQENKLLKEHYQLNRHKQFGSSSEVTPDQMQLFNETEKEADASVKEPE